MRPFPSIPLDFIGNENIKSRARSSPRINPDELSRIKSDAVEGIDLSSGSIDEFKRIEALLTSDPNSILKEFGVNLGRLDKARDISDFNTVSFNLKDEIKFLGLGNTNAKLPARDANKEEYVPYDDFSANILQGFTDLSTQDIYFSKTLSQKTPPKPATFKERLERMKAEKKATAAAASVLSRSETEGERFDTESTFGIKRIPRAEAEFSNQIKLFNKMPRLSESPPMRAIDAKGMRQPRFAGELDGYYDEEESSIYVLENDLKAKNSFMRSSWDERLKTISQSLSAEENGDIDSYLKHLMVPRRMKISIGGIPFQDVIFVLSLRFFDKSSHIENFVFEWSDVKTGEMIGYIRCDYISHVHKQSLKRFNIACKEPNEGKPDTLHHVHVETEAPVMSDLYVSGLNAVVKYMQRNAAYSRTKGI